MIVAAYHKISDDVCSHLCNSAEAQGTIGQQGGTIQGIQIRIFQGLQFLFFSTSRVGLEWVFRGFFVIKRGTLKKLETSKTMNFNGSWLCLCVLLLGSGLFFQFVSCQMNCFLLNWNHNKSVVCIYCTWYRATILKNHNSVYETPYSYVMWVLIQQKGWKIHVSSNITFQTPGKQQATCMFSIHSHSLCRISPWKPYLNEHAT